MTRNFYDLLSSLNIIRVTKSRRIRCAVHVARTGDRRCEYSVLVGRPEGKKPLGRPRLRWHVKLTLGQTMKAQLGFTGIALPLL
jgi:hypothetical protein